MARLLPVLLVTALALSLPPLTHALPSNWWAWLWGGPVNTPTLGPERAVIGPGCANGNMDYPGIPTEVVSQCPSTDPPEPIMITNEYDCSSYFLCEEGIAELICCPAGYLYDPPMLTCDDPPHVDCGSRPILPPKETTITTITTTESTTESTTITSSTTTEEGPTSTEPTTTTPATTEPTSTTETFTTSETTSASTTSKTTTTTEPPPPPIDSKCDDLPGYFGNLPVDGDCYSYYECDGSGTNAGIIHTCPVGSYGQMVYNPTTQECDDQWHYPCEDHMIHTYWW